MFWLTTILLVGYIIAYIVTYIIDPTESIYTRQQSIDTTSIKEISEEYVQSLGIEIKKPICYKFVTYKHEEQMTHSTPSNAMLLGTFHEWNDTYYIDISANLYKLNLLKEIVIHETRHMVVQELKNEKIINLLDYTEEIAQGDNKIYNDLFDNSVKLLKNKQNGISLTSDEKRVITINDVNE